MVWGDCCRCSYINSIVGVVLYQHWDDHEGGLGGDIVVADLTLTLSLSLLSRWLWLWDDSREDALGA